MFRRYMIVLFVVLGLCIVWTVGLARSSESYRERWWEYWSEYNLCLARGESGCTPAFADTALQLRNETQARLDIAVQVSGGVLLMIVLSGVIRWVYNGRARA